MKKTILLILCLFGFTACTPTLPAKKTTMPAVVKSEKAAIKKQRIHGNILYYLRTPQEDQRLYKQFSNQLNNMSNTKDFDQLDKIRFPYYNPLYQALKRRKPENDAQEMINRGKHFLLGYGGGMNRKVRMSGTLLFPLGFGRGQTKKSKYAGLKCNFIPLKGLEGVGTSCPGNSQITQHCNPFYSLKTDYIIRWNIAMYEHCRKNQ